MYGLIGYPLSHSFSADFFNKKFREEKIDESYDLFPIETISVLPEFLKTRPELNGLNVTIPYKEKVLPYLDAISDEASQIGAVNVIRIERSGDSHQLCGYNTDAKGFHDSIMPLMKPHMQNALILGTGGASRAVEFVLRKMGLGMKKVSRNPREGQLSYSQLTPDILSSHHVIVNTTPLGMWPDVDNAPDIPYSLLTHYHLCYDLIYNPEETAFLKKASEHRAAVKNGLEMLHIQALAAWEIWQV